MANYQREYSKFPQELIKLRNYQNVDERSSNLVGQIQALRKAGKYGEASALIKNNASLLEQYNVDAASINTIIEEIYNTQLYAKGIQQCIFFENTEPENAWENDVWIGA